MEHMDWEPKFLCRFNERITITYNLEAEKFTGKRVSRVFFNTYKFNRDKSHITDGNLRLFRQAEDRERCVSERAYIKVREILCN